MPGPTCFLAEIALPSLRDGLAFAAPVLTLAALWWLVLRTDRMMHAAFPDLEFERSLGWLNIRAERRANRAMRWIGYAVVVLLVDSLAIILWAATGMPRLADWSDPWVMGELALRIPALGFCLLIWVIYLGLGLVPRLRAEREAAAYRKFRAEMKADEEERAVESPARVHTPLPKPRANPQPTTLTPRRHWRRHPPGG
jgi:hypothetical protein